MQSRTSAELFRITRHSLMPAVSRFLRGNSTHRVYIPREVCWVGGGLKHTEERCVRHTVFYGSSPPLISDYSHWVGG